MINTERRLELAFEFIEAALKDPKILESVPDRAVIALGDEADPALTKESLQLAHDMAKTEDLPVGIALRHRPPGASEWAFRK